ncbi:tyrosine-type recombinase/integrase [Pimelobacter simplex]|uniref:tyrosine-type recombinase/integrase n=1 Tax=Nocardioides simplex TaxID=2045 RepID=UPI00214FEE78|nr:site-specific integrase [Pimelobacter simplex]UUW88423.1 site-specific integrase [Pimelobacter simplex]UUW97927.1 site-specific integrase [Pimelobacter simplex]
MASIDRLPSGKWRATVVTPIKQPNGRFRRVTKTDPLKAVVEHWAKRTEAAIATGTWIAPENAATTLGEYRAVWRKTKVADSSSIEKNDSHWRVHIEPVWAGHPLGLIVRPDLKSWVKQLATEQCRRCHASPGIGADGLLKVHKTSLTGAALLRAQRREEPTVRRCSGSGIEPGLGAWTIQGIVSHLSGLLTSAVEDGLIPANPALRLNLPPARPKPIFFWHSWEAEKIILELEEPYALAVDLDMHVGYRPGELFGLTRRYVDVHTWQIYVHGVATRTGWRPYAKSTRSHRATPIPKRLRERVAEHVEDLGPDDLLFPAPGGGVWDDRNFARRIFTPAIKRAGVKLGTPYDMRHTAASWLVQKGVDLKRVQDLLGHEKYSTTLRYAHLKPGAFDEVLDAWGD